MTRYWVRFRCGEKSGWGELTGDRVVPLSRPPFEGGGERGDPLPLETVHLLQPLPTPGKFIGLWNNFHQRAAEEGLTPPAHPLWFVKTANCCAGPGEVIRRPEGYAGPVAFEGELGIVVGRRCRNADREEAQAAIFGYTCVNDVTARGEMRADPAFVQWCRAKSHDTFGPFGPVIASGLDPGDLRVRVRIDGEPYQDYPVADMIFDPVEIVRHLSRDVTLEAGDLIACGTSVGAREMPDGCRVEVEIDRIGVLVNRFGA